MNTARTTLENKFLYKFRNIKKDPNDPSKPDASKLDFIKRIFTHNELHFPAPLDLNDPLDCRPSFVVGDLTDPRYRRRFVSHVAKEMLSRGVYSNPREVIEWLNRVPQGTAIKAALDQSNDFREVLEKELRICSFCSAPNSPIVWSHYADSHKGFCLVFDADNNLFGEALEVQYQQDYPTIDVTEEDNEIILEKTILIKYEDWKYEREYRLSSREPGNQDMLPVQNKKLAFPPEYLVGVILGAHIVDQDRQLIEEWCKGRPAGFIQKAEFCGDKYDLNITDA